MKSLLHNTIDKLIDSTNCAQVKLKHNNINLTFTYVRLLHYMKYICFLTNHSKTFNMYVHVSRNSLWQSSCLYIGIVLVYNCRSELDGGYR